MICFARRQDDAIPSERCRAREKRCRRLAFVRNPEYGTTAGTIERTTRSMAIFSVMSVQRRYKEIYTSYTNSAKIDANDAVDRYAKTLAV
jgi:hypothetical protein